MSGMSSLIAISGNAKGPEPTNQEVQRFDLHVMFALKQLCIAGHGLATSDPSGTLIQR